MKNNTETPTVAFKTCNPCGAQLSASYRFCRLCGADQSLPESSTKRLDPTPGRDTNAKGLVTSTEREASSQAAGYSSISGSIMNSLAMSDLPVASSLIRSRAAKKFVTAVIALPLWLMIILLSPLDALEASRRVARQL